MMNTILSHAWEVAKGNLSATFIGFALCIIAIIGSFQTDFGQNLIAFSVSKQIKELLTENESLRGTLKAKDLHIREIENNILTLEANADRLKVNYNLLEEKYVAAIKEAPNCNAAKIAAEEKVRSCESKLLPSREIHNITAPGSITVEGNSVKLSKIYMKDGFISPYPDKCVFEIGKVKRGDPMFYPIGKNEDADVYFDSRTIYTIHVTGLTDAICSFYISKKTKISE